MPSAPGPAFGIRGTASRGVPENSEEYLARLDNYELPPEVPLNPKKMKPNRFAGRVRFAHGGALEGAGQVQAGIAAVGPQDYYALSVRDSLPQNAGSKPVEGDPQAAAIQDPLAEQSKPFLTAKNAEKTKWKAPRPLRPPR
jgi:hypothetical protein